MKDGIYNLSNDEYHKSKGISSSGINLILESPAKYYHQYMSGLEKIDTKAMIIGTALHMLALEPELVKDHFIVLPQGLNRTRKADKLIYAEALKASALTGKKLIKFDEFNEASSMAYAINKNKSFCKIKETKGHIEQSLFFTNKDGVLLRSRPDFYNDIMIMDVKTSESANHEDFQRSILKYGYHRQAALQIDAVKAVTGKELPFIFFEVEKKAPHLTALYRLDDESIELGRKEYKEGARIFKHCSEMDDWPGYDDMIQSISLPDWYIRKHKENN